MCHVITTLPRACCSTKICQACEYDSRGSTPAQFHDNSYPSSQAHSLDPTELTSLKYKERFSLSTAIMSLTNCRFYEEKYPEIDSFVMVNVKQASVAPTEYDQECSN